jgi:hypothetical protein
MDGAVEGESGSLYMIWIRRVGMLKAVVLGWKVKL